MKRLFRDSLICAAFAVCAMWLAAIPAAAQTASAARRTADGKPDFNGIWQALNSASWDIQDHTGELGVPPGRGIVEGGEIPYQPSALAKKRENYANRKTADPTEANCYMPGVPRANYMPFPLEIVQTPQYIIIRYEFAHAARTIHIDGSPHPEGVPGNWMGDSRGRWEGNALVVDVRNFNDRTWFDLAGNHHSDALHVVERYTLTGADHILYEATIEDPNVFTRPWKISMPLYRRIERNAKILEYECVFYLQEEKYRNAPFR